MTKRGSKGYLVGQFQGIYLRPMSHYRKSGIRDPTMRYFEEDEIEDEIARLSEVAYKPPDVIERRPNGTVLMKWYHNPEDSPTWSGITLKGNTDE